MKSVVQAQLPVRLVELLRRIDSEFPQEGELTLGPVTFRAARGALGDSLVEQLIAQRWSAMPPELLPFAMDAMGNSFCLVRSAVHHDSEKLPVVYWMYETKLAVPVASCFDRFLDWIGLASEIYVRRGASESMTRDHLERVVKPQLRALGVERDFFALTTSPVSPVGSLHLGMMRLDPAAAGSRLVAAERARRDNRQKDAILHARAALKSFPKFFAAAWFLVTFQNAPTRVIGYRELVHGLVALPLAYRGDPQMPEFLDIPSPTILEVAERVSSVAREGDLDDDPVIELMMWDDPMAPEAWLSAAIELANRQQLARAHVAALNAAHLVRDPDVLHDIWTFQLELYEAMGWSWQSYVVARHLEQAAQPSSVLLGMP